MEIDKINIISIYLQNFSKLNQTVPNEQLLYKFLFLLRTQTTNNFKFNTLFMGIG